MQALDAMAEIQERHEAVKDLEESLADLHQIFLDMSVLVDAQGEMLDNIEQQVGPTPCTPCVPQFLVCHHSISPYQYGVSDAAICKWLFTCIRAGLH